jgi:alpha-tubulin suppressor-like RCC1 family protein
MSTRASAQALLKRCAGEGSVGTFHTHAHVGILLELLTRACCAGAYNALGAARRPGGRWSARAVVTGACAAGSALGLASGLIPSLVVCEKAQAEAAANGASFIWGRRFTGNEIVGCVWDRVCACAQTELPRLIPGSMGRYCDKVPVEVDIGGRQSVHIAFGTSVGASCDTSGDVWWWGTQAAGDGPAHATHAQRILRSKRIVKVACGASYSYALSRNGRVWKWPNTAPHAIEELSVPGGLLFSGSVVDMAACATGGHFLCVTSDGRALAMGNGAKGQLGCGDCEDKTQLTPVKMPKGSAAAKCAAGANHSLVLTRDGSVLAFGADDVMQLGQGRDTISQWKADKEPLTSAIFRTEPTKIILPRDLTAAGERATAVAVAAGHDFSAAIFETPGKPNCLVSWGNGWRKQLGHKVDMHMSAPRVVKTLQGRKEWSQKSQMVVEMGVKAVACGQEHMLALLDNGSLLAWGGNREGEIGNDTRADSKTPQLVMALQRYRAASVFAGSRNSAAIIEGPAEYL